MIGLSRADLTPDTVEVNEIYEVYDDDDGLWSTYDCLPDAETVAINRALENKEDTYIKCNGEFEAYFEYDEDNHKVWRQ